MSARFGLVGFPLGQLGPGLKEAPAQIVTQIAREADAAGFDFLCAQDHVLAPREWVGDREVGKTWFDPIVILAWAGAVTTRIKLCTDIMVMPYRSPFTMAKITGSLDAVSGGRLILGVAAGYLEREFEILGVPFPDRGARTDEAIEVLKACWTNDWVTVDGERFRARDVAVSPRPVQQPRPPIWVGGNSDRALRRAVEHADGWTPFRAPPERIREALARARDEFGLTDRPFSVAVPIRRGVYRDDRRKLDLSSIERQIEALTAAGASHLRVGFRGPTLDDYLRDMGTFAERFLVGR